MAPLAADPEALSGAGATVISAGDGLAAAVGALASGFGANTGQDAAGEVFGLAYQDAAESVLKAAAAGINACRTTGYLVQASASNYSKAEAASTLGGGADVLPTPTRPGEFAAPGAPWTLGPGVPAPALWAVVEAFVGDVWPNGNSAQIHAAATCWRTFGAALGGVKDALSSPNSVVGAQQIVEREAIEHRLSELGTVTAGIGAECDKLAGRLDDFADHVQHTQDAVRDLLHRLGSVSGLWHEVVEVFEGHGLDEVKQIAEDIKAVLRNLMAQAQALGPWLQHGMEMLDGLVRGLQIYVRSEIVHYVGEDIGNPLATAFDTYVNFGEGVFKGAEGMVEGLQQLNPSRFAYDPQGAANAWMDLTKGGVINSFLNPEEAVQANEKMLKGLLHLDDWSRDRPGLGAGENLFDVATLFAPGLGGAGAGARATTDAARAASEAGDAAGAVGRGGRALGETGEVARATGAMSDISKTTSGLTKDLEGIRTDSLESTAPTGGRPGALPPPKLIDAPAGPPPRPVESAPPVSPRPSGDQPAAAAPGTLRKTTVSSTSEALVPSAAAPGEGLRSFGSPLGEPSPPQVPVTANAQPAPPTLAGAHSPQSAPIPPPHGPNPDSDLGGHPPDWSGDGDHGPGGSGAGDGQGRDANESGNHASGDGSGPGENSPSDHGDTSPAGVTDEMRDEILSIEKGIRPDPAEYLSPKYIDHHLDKFDEGVTRFMPETNLEKYGIAQRDGTSFVMPKSEADAMISATRGDPRAMERALGLIEGFLDSNRVVRIDIDHPREFDLRIPSGNEAGANEQWIPGGLLPGGASEAVIDGGKIPKDDYTVTDVFK
jgi:hypothetical protein